MKLNKDMHCKQCQKNLDAFLDGQLTKEETEKMHMHLQVCGHCQERLRQQQILIDLIRNSAVAPPEDLHERVMNAIGSDADAVTNHYKRSRRPYRSSSLFCRFFSETGSRAYHRIALGAASLILLFGIITFSARFFSMLQQKNSVADESTDSNIFIYGASDACEDLCDIDSSSGDAEDSMLPKFSLSQILNSSLYASNDTAMDADDWLNHDEFDQQESWSDSGAVDNSECADALCKNYISVDEVPRFYAGSSEPCDLKKNTIVLSQVDQFSDIIPENGENIGNYYVIETDAYFDASIAFADTIETLNELLQDIAISDEISTICDDVFFAQYQLCVIKYPLYPELITADSFNYTVNISIEAYDGVSCVILLPMDTEITLAIIQ